VNIETGLSALKAVQTVVPEALLAGGYLRDCLLGREPKDIDIFIPYQGAEIRAFRELPGAHTDIPECYMEQSEVASVGSLRGFEMPVQVIELRPGLNPLDRVKAHDFGICQVWSSGDGFSCTPAFLHDIRCATFTLTECNDAKEYARSMRRWYRLSKKYPDYTLVVPQEIRSKYEDEQ